MSRKASQDAQYVNLGAVGLQKQKTTTSSTSVNQEQTAEAAVSDDLPKLDILRQEKFSLRQFSWDGQMVVSELNTNSLNPWTQSAFYEQSKVVYIVQCCWETSFDTLLIQSTNPRLNAKAHMSVVADHVHSFMATICPSSNGYF